MVDYDNNKDYIVYFKDTNHAYLVTKDGKSITEINNPPSLVTETIYVTLYNDGTLAFSNNNETDNTKTITKTYTIGKDDLYDKQSKVPWNNETSSIEKVTFVNEIKPTSTQRWFYRCVNLAEIENIENLNTSKVLSMAFMFCGARKLETLDLSTFDTRRVKSMQEMFSSYTDDGNYEDGMNLKNLNLSSFDTNKVTNIASMFNRCKKLENIDVTNFNTKNVTTMRGLFIGCIKLKSIDLSHFDTSNVTTMQSMFENCYELSSLDVSNFNTSNVTTMYCMFYHCESLTSLDLSNFNTNNVNSMSCMLCGCSSLINLDISSLNTSNVTTMYCMFYNCNKLTSLDLSHFDTGNVTNMDYMFCRCSSLLDLDISNFDTGNVTTMRDMFYCCIQLEELDLSSFDTHSLKITRWMFGGWDDENNTDLIMGIKTIYVSSLWNMSEITDDYGMFLNCRNLVGEKGTRYNSSKQTSLYARVDGGSTSSSPGYFTYKSN